MEYRYNGFYARFETPSKKLGGLMMSADVLIGDPFEIFFKPEDDSHAWLRNRFGAEIGFLDVDSTRDIKLARARGQIVNAHLAFIAYSEAPDPGLFWGEVAIICYDANLEETFAPFIAQLKSKLTNGIRPDVCLRSADVDRLIADNTWFPNSTTPLPVMEPGTAPLKTKLSLTERIIEKGRAGSIVMYVVSIAFVVALACGAIWLIVSLF